MGGIIALLVALFCFGWGVTIEHDIAYNSGFKDGAISATISETKCTLIETKDKHTEWKCIKSQ